MTFSEKIISPTFVLGDTPLPIGQSGPSGPPGTFGGSPNNTATFTGLRAHADIQSGGGMAQGSATCRFYGLPLAVMNQLSITQLQMTGQGATGLVHNSLTLEAGDTVSGVQSVFAGQIAETWVDAAGQPEVCLIVVANAGIYGALAPVRPISYGQSVDVATLIAGIAQSMGWQYETNGVSIILPKVYLHGSVYNQMSALCNGLPIEWVLDYATEPPTLAIWPRGSARGLTVPLIAPATGMIGSPQYNGAGIVVTCAFNPAIRFGQWVRVESMILNATATWYVAGVHHVLDSQMPGGAWFTVLDCVLMPDMIGGR